MLWQAGAKIDNINARLQTIWNGEADKTDYVALEAEAKHVVAEANIAIARIKVQLSEADSFRGTGSSRASTMG